MISQPTYSAVTVMGLAVGLAAFFLLLGYVKYSFDYDSYDKISVLTLRFNGDKSTLLGNIAKLWTQSFPAEELDMRSATTALNESYVDDMRLAKLLVASSLLSIAIAAFGIYVLSAYAVQRRTNEIILRKLYGASGGLIAGIIAREFGMLIAVGALIGLPLVVFASSTYLAQFVEHASMGIWPLVGALLVAVIVASVGICRHLMIAVGMSPLIALQT